MAIQPRWAVLVLVSRKIPYTLMDFQTFFICVLFFHCNFRLCHTQLCYNWQGYQYHSRHQKMNQFPTHLAKIDLNPQKNKRSLDFWYVEAFLKATSNLSANQNCPSVHLRILTLKFYSMATWHLFKHFLVILCTLMLFRWHHCKRLIID